MEKQNNKEYRLRAKTTATINRDLKRTGKAIVALGCSYAQGHGAFDEETLKLVRPKISSTFSNFDYMFKGHTESELQLLADHYDLELIEKSEVAEHWNGSESQYAVATHEIETANSFVNQICEKLGNRYTPINFGHAGNGNLASINRLFTFPIDWHLCDEIILLWCYSDPNRFDIVDDRFPFNKHLVLHDHATMWPQFQDEYDPECEKLRQGSLWFETQRTYTQTLWSDKFSYTNFLNAGIQLSVWAKAHNAKLVTFGAFQPCTKEDIINGLLDTEVVRDPGTRQLIESKKRRILRHEIIEAKKGIDMFPWKSVFNPGGYNTFFDLAYSQEPDYIPGTTMHDVVNNCLESGDDWIFPCGHPSAKAHTLLSDIILEHLNLGYQND